MIMQALTMASGVYNHNWSTMVSISIIQDNSANNLNSYAKVFKSSSPLSHLMHYHLLEILYLDSLIATVLSYDVEEL
tara:strand:- start:497 stop:727 length:231 start_codon:yes stop_codon:yes gene_type:complete